MAEEKKENTMLKAKTWSLIGKIAALAIIIGGNFLKWMGRLPNASGAEINACGLCCWAVFATVDANIIIDKFLK